jgi:hypothetical protein
LQPDRYPVPGPGSVIIVPPQEVKVGSGLPWVAVLSTAATLATGIAAIVSLSR